MRGCQDIRLYWPNLNIRYECRSPGGGGGHGGRGGVSAHANASGALWRDLGRTETEDRRETPADREMFESLVARHAWKGSKPRLLLPDEWTEDAALRTRRHKDAIVRRIAAEADRQRRDRPRPRAPPDLVA